MPGLTLRELSVALGLDVEAASFAKGQLAVDAIETGLGLIVKAAEFAARALVDLVASTVRYASDINDTAQAIGIGTAALQELQFAASISGVSAEELSASVGLLSRNMGEAAKGGGEAGEAFAKLGVHLKDANGKLRPTEEVIGDIAEGISKLPDGAAKTGLALQLLGRSGKRLIPLLNEGRAGIADLRQEAEDLGIVLSDDTIKQGDELGDTFDRLRAVTAGLKRSIAAALFPTLTEIGKSMIAWVRANREIIKQKLVAVLTAITSAAQVLGDVLLHTVRTATFLADGIVFLVTKLWDLLGLVPGLRIGILAIAAAWIFLTTPILQVAAAVAAVVLALDDLRVYLEGGDSLIGRWIASLDEWLKPRSADPWWLSAIKDFLTQIREVLTAMREFDELVNPQKAGDRFNKTSKEIQSQADAQTLRTARGRVLSGLGLTDVERAALKRGGVSEQAFVTSTKQRGLDQPLPPGFADRYTAAPGGAPGQGAGVYLPQFVPTTAPPGAGSRNFEQTNHLQIVAAPGQSPEDVGDAVVRKINELGLIGTRDLEAANAATGR